jgi:leader peptidase (prepilin peptidase)/N-methyltransferase
MELSIAFIFGVAIGSFLNVVILRIPKDETIIFGGSHCISCGENLKPWHNIPIFSWLFLRGRCAFCGSKISAQYPLVELFSGLILLTLVHKFGFSLPVILITLSFFMLLCLSLIDLKYKLVPDSLNLLAMFFAIIGAWSLQGIFTNFQNALLFAGGFTLLRFSLSYYLTSSAHRHANKTITSWTKNYQTYPFIEAMGEGDIMVGATMGALLGVKLTLAAIFLSAVLALPIMLILMRTSKEPVTVPFVPFLTLATFVVYIFDSQVLTYIEALY